MTNDIDSYIDNEYFDSCNEPDQDKRVENINNAFYDGGYIAEKGDGLCGFGSAYEAEDFIIDICSHHEEYNAWHGKKPLVETYVEIAKGYLSRGKFDLVKDGHYSDGGERKAQELTDELGWGKREVRQTLLACLTADDFVHSGKNSSKYECNKGTVVMVFSPRVETMIYYTDTQTGKRMKKRKVIDLYVKMVLNPHPDRSRNQTEMQVLSFREAGSGDKAKTCLYTGEERRSRVEWNSPGFRNHKDRPLTMKEMKEKN